MAGRKSIGDLHANVTANASQFVSEFQRADNAARRSAVTIDKEVDKLTKSVKGKFSLSSFGKDALKGLGIGSGFAVAQEAANQLVAYWERAAAAAQAIEASTSKQLANVQAMIRSRQTEEQQLVGLQKELDAVIAKQADLNAPKTRGAFNYLTGRMGSVSVGMDAKEVEQAQALAERANEIGREMQALRDKLAKDEATTLAKSTETARRLGEERAKDAQQLADRLAQSYARVQAAVAESDRAIEAQAEVYRRMGDPLREYQQQLAEVIRLEQAGALTGLQAAQARAALIEKNAPGPDLAALKEIDGLVMDLDENAKRAQETARELGLTFTSAFEDAIIEGGKLGDVLRGLAQDLLRLFARKNITEPLFESLMGSSLFKGLGGLFGGARAAGGPVESGKAYLVGEQGPEMFSPGSSGTIIPAAATAVAMGGGRGGGGTYYIDARGADRAGLARLEAMIAQTRGMIVPGALGAVLNAKARGFRGFA